MKQLMADTKFYEAYARYGEGKYETWEDAVDRVMDMHRQKYKGKMSPRLNQLMVEVSHAYKSKRILGAQRALQFGGEQLRNEEIRLYNCSSTYADRPDFFGEAMYMMLCGAGIGFSVQRHHIAKLPDISPRTKGFKSIVVDDSIAGWADAINDLVASYFSVNGQQIVFDFSKIRPEGAFISGGFKAPGPKPLKLALANIQTLLDHRINDGASKLSPINVYDIVMYAADAVIAGGVRRSATICLFDHDDDEMANAKTGNWFIDNPQRGRSNNSAVIVRDEIPKERFSKLMKSVREFGEPGFILTDSKDFTYNPCVEIGMLPVTKDGRTGWQFCCLTEINGGACKTKEDFYAACHAASVLCTIQAGYTNFGYVSSATKEITEREALIGVSVTGWMENADLLFQDEVMREGAQVVKRANKEVAELIGINQAARCTCVKPSGNASVLLGTSSGIHGQHSKRYIRHIQLSKGAEVAKLIQRINPEMVEDSVWSANGTDIVIGFPITSAEGSMYKSDLLGISQLDYVKKAQQVWIEEGTNVELCVDPRLRHNVSNTITVDNWEEVEKYVWDNRKYFAGISFLGMSGDRDYVQAPFAEVKSASVLVKEYGEAAMFASGLIVDGLHAFNNDLWNAITTALNYKSGERVLPETAENVLKRDWVRRFCKYSDTYFSGDSKRAEYCLKDVFYLHKFTRISNKSRDIDWATELTERQYTDINTLGAQACSGGSCDVTF